MSAIMAMSLQGCSDHSRMRPRWWLLCGALAAALTLQVQAQSHAAHGVLEGAYSSEELVDLVAPIALYPDDLVAIIVPASTYPLQIVQAARLLEERNTDATLGPSQWWDDAVVALLNYPEVLRLMDEDLDWTEALGAAVRDRRGGVIDAIQDFRTRAYAAGNLRSDERQHVASVNGIIKITPVNPRVVYVPYYEPEQVVVRQRRPVYHYYAVPYPLYYYPYPVGYSFAPGFFWGVTTAFTIAWSTRYLHVHHHRHVTHPYHRRSYHWPYYTRRGVNIGAGGHRSAQVWRPVRGPRAKVRRRDPRVDNVTGQRRRGSVREHRAQTPDSARPGAAHRSERRPAGEIGAPRTVAPARKRVHRPGDGAQGRAAVRILDARAESRGDDDRAHRVDTSVRGDNARQRTGRMTQSGRSDRGRRSFSKRGNARRHAR